MTDVKCSECDGRGVVDSGASGFDEDPEETCQWCEGKGSLDADIRAIQEMNACLAMLPFAPVVTTYREYYDANTIAVHTYEERRKGEL